MGFKCPHCTEGIEGVIAKSRFDDVYNERKALKASTAILEKERDDALASAGEVEQWKSKAAEAEAGLTAFKRRSTITDAGFSSDLVDAVEWAYSKIEGDEKPELGEVLQAWASDPEAAPVILRPHLPKAVETPPATPPVPGAPPPKAPPVNPDQGRRQYGKAPQVITPTSIASSTKEQHEALLAQLDAKGMGAIS
jgi:hypothetical protein